MLANIDQLQSQSLAIKKSFNQNTIIYLIWIVDEHVVHSLIEIIWIPGWMWTKAIFQFENYGFKCELIWLNKKKTTTIDKFND